MQHPDLFASVSAQAPLGIYLTDAGGRCTYVNRRWCEMAGMPPEEAMGHGWAQALHPEDRRTIRERWERMVNTGDPSLGEYRFRDPGGRETWVAGHASPLHDEGGRLIGYVGMTIDISARKGAEAALVTNRRELRAMIDAAFEGVILIRPDGEIIECNRAFAERFGGHPREFIGRNVLDLIPPEIGERRLEKLRQVLAAGNPVRFEDSREGRDFLHSLSPVKDQEGRVEAVAIFVSDITERKRAERERLELEARFRHIQKMDAIGALAGGIAHDFNNILAIITGYCELAMRQLKGIPAAQDSLEQILHAGKRGRALTGQILAFSRQREPETRPLDLKHIVRETVRFLQSSLPATIEIRQEIRARDTIVRGDPSQIHQMLMNLGTNAGHAMRETGGTLTVRLQDRDLTPEEAAHLPGLEPGRHLALSVEDTGAGMENEVLDRIFEPFFTTKDPGQGTGMGLAVVHGVVKAHGGTISVSSEPGAGTAFHVLLPALADEPEEAPEVSRPPETGHARVLFVDDEEAIAEWAQEMLGALGYSVTARTVGPEALELFRKGPDRFDLVITDMTMPRLTGLDLAREILRVRPGIPIILCTGFSEALSPESAAAMGIRELLMKPVLADELTAAIRRALEPESRG